MSAALEHSSPLLFSDRILAIKGGELKPLLAATPAGRPSPSRSLLVERLEVAEPGRQTHVLTDHVLTLFLRPTMMQHVPNGGRSSDLPLDAGQVVICVR